MTEELRNIGRNFDKYQVKLKSKPFGRFLGEGAERNVISNFDMPYHKILETKPLLD
jgi:hypothetical protein